MHIDALRLSAVCTLPKSENLNFEKLKMSDSRYFKNFESPYICYGLTCDKILLCDAWQDPTPRQKLKIQILKIGISRTAAILNILKSPYLRNRLR